MSAIPKRTVIVSGQELSVVKFIDRRATAEDAQQEEFLFQKNESEQINAEPAPHRSGQIQQTTQNHL